MYVPYNQRQYKLFKKIIEDPNCQMEETSKYAVNFMIESERRYFDNAKIDLMATYADYPETANNYIL